MFCFQIIGCSNVTWLCYELDLAYTASSGKQIRTLDNQGQLLTGFSG